MDCTEYLLKLLGTYKVFEYNTHLMHRQVVGPLFEEFHETMKEHYEYAETTMDDVAERIRMLGGEMPTKMCELVEKSSMNFLSSTPDMQTAIQLVVKMHDYMIGFLKEGIAMATQKEDYYSEDLLRGRCAWHEKQKRLLGSRVGKALDGKPKEEDGKTTDPESDKVD